MTILMKSFEREFFGMTLLSKDHKALNIDQGHNQRTVCQ